MSNATDSVQWLIWIMVLTEDIVLPDLPDLPRLRLDEELWLDKEGGGVREWEGPWLGRGMPTGPGEGLKPKVPL